MKIVVTFICLLSFHPIFCQYKIDSIYTAFVLKEKRVQMMNRLQNKTIEKVFNTPFDSTEEQQYEEACWAISQFLIEKPYVYKGFKTLFKHYNLLQNSTKRSFLEAVYAVYPFQFVQQIQQISIHEKIPKLFAMQILYLQRASTQFAQKSNYLNCLEKRKNDWNDDEIIIQLHNYLLQNNPKTIATLPPIIDWFIEQKRKGIKTVYSFQKWNRNYAGLAIIQFENGEFAKDNKGNLLVFEQLARSASNLPYFITNGNTPQGIFSIQGVDISTNLFIGPTPNLQLLMPFENDSLFYKNMANMNLKNNYQNMLPNSWQNYKPIYESFFSGKVGRTEIIAHGTTIDIELFKNKPFYQFTPTLGCLCAKEIWNNHTGKLEYSDQLNLVNTYLQTAEKQGMLVVININQLPKAVNRQEIEKLVVAFEKNKK